MTDSQQRQALIDEIRQMRPWHHNIQLTEDLQVRDAFSEEERQKENNDNVAIHNTRRSFQTKLGLMYPDGMQGKRFLDCACNAGGYCFWASELGAKAYGFDVRDHWINQASFSKQHRSAWQKDNVHFEVRDLMTLPEMNLEPADLTLFKGIFYHLADPVLGLKIAADLTREVIWVNTNRCFIDNTESLYCTFEAPEHPMSGVHALSWIPSGPSVIGKMLYWLGFTDIWHVFSKRYDHRPQIGRMEVIASRVPGLLDELARKENCENVDVASYRNSLQATDDIKALF